MPDFRSRAFLLDHVRAPMAFYHPRAVDRNGGFFHFFRDDGSVYDAVTRHLVSSARFVFDYAMAARHFGSDDYRKAARHGIAFLRERQRNSQTGGYAWLLRDNAAVDATNHCYGLAFVLLAYAHASMAGIDEARPWIAETFQLMEDHFWSDRYGLYADEASADWSRLSPYRGQNANMHGCEAMLAAFDATGEPRYLERAEILARNITLRQADLGQGLIWVQAESLAAAALLAVRTGLEKYWGWYDRIWAYSWQWFVDHQYGAWYRILTRDNRKYSDEKSPAGKTDYHTMGACYEVLNVIPE